MGLRLTHVVLLQNHLPQCVDTLYSKVCKLQKQKSFTVLCAHPERDVLLIPTVEAPVLNQDDNMQKLGETRARSAAAIVFSHSPSTLLQVCPHLCGKRAKRNEVLAVLPTAHSQPANAGF